MDIIAATARSTAATPSADASDWTPEGLTFDEFQSEYARLRDECPVAHSTAYNGFWTLTRYADVRRAALNPFTFESGRPFLRATQVERFIPLTLNPPEHAGYRRILNPLFTATRVATIANDVRDLVDEQLGPLLLAGGGDFAADVGYPLPARVLCRYLSLPDSLAGKLKQLGHERIAGQADPGRALAVAGEFQDLVRAVVADRRSTPRDGETDIFSALLEATVDGERLSDDDITAIGFQLFAAGHDTTSSAITSMAYLLATHPEQQEQLRADHALIPTAIDEALRFEPPLHNLARTTAEDTEVRGCPIAAHSTVALNWASANRDAEKFTDPESFDVTRAPNQHLSFGHGPHKCIGAPLARLQLTAVLEKLLTGTTWFELDGTPQRATITTSGFDALVLKFAAGSTR